MKISVQQALFHHFVQPVSRIALVAAINRRTAWNHVHAAPKSHVKPWTRRSIDDQRAAIKEARRFVKRKGKVSHSNGKGKAIVPAPHSKPVATQRPRIPLGILHALIDVEVASRVQSDDTFTAYSVTKLLRALNPNHEIDHGDVQARVRMDMTAYTHYEMIFQNWNGEAARTWRPKPVGPAIQISAPQPAQLPSGIRIVDDDE